MRLLPRVLALVAACAIFPAAHAACTAATIKGYFAAGGSGSYSSTYPAFQMAHVYFNGVNGVQVVYKEGEFGTVYSYTGAGTYQIDQYCRGTASITLTANGVVTDVISLSFMVSGSPTAPQITALVSNPATEYTGGAFLNKINL